MSLIPWEVELIEDIDDAYLSAMAERSEKAPDKTNRKSPEPETIGRSSSRNPAGN